jgi:hypothetical protein
MLTFARWLFVLLLILSGAMTWGRKSTQEKL